ERLGRCFGSRPRQWRPPRHRWTPDDADTTVKLDEGVVSQRSQRGEARASGRKGEKLFSWSSPSSLSTPQTSVVRERGWGGGGVPAVPSTIPPPSSRPPPHLIARLNPTSSRS